MMEATSATRFPSVCPPRISSGSIEVALDESGWVAEAPHGLHSPPSQPTVTISIARHALRMASMVASFPLLRCPPVQKAAPTLLCSCVSGQPKHFCCSFSMNAFGSLAIVAQYTGDPSAMPSAHFTSSHVVSLTRRSRTGAPYAVAPAAT
eukprot:TRINITY_DN5762_c0_g1_i2.p1 TRINITY_DN5762_c0_g1~~TRINITY_DN5762_c0_g1_i2.p1  ORF type:complete len:150 (-),score=24.00 TRINITY_DN5762_c0_g1_i2:153-602(-)